MECLFKRRDGQPMWFINNFSGRTYPQVSVKIWYEGPFFEQKLRYFRVSAKNFISEGLKKKNSVKDKNYCLYHLKMFSKFQILKKSAKTSKNLKNP